MTVVSACLLAGSTQNDALFVKLAQALHNPSQNQKLKLNWKKELTALLFFIELIVFATCNTDCICKHHILQLK